MEKVHLIAIGGAVMHNLAIALKRAGYEVSGSDDAIYDPARSNLKREGILPESGWNADRINSRIDQIILGMHARADNPELQRARELGIPISSFPQFIAERSKKKKRVVVAGSHGKTTTTSMIMHALRKAGKDFDYLVGSSIEGFELSVRLSNSDLIIIEGDEYLSSALDSRPKFLWYEPDISIITGIAYDHINVFPSYDSYLEAFEQFIGLHQKDDHIIWFGNDPDLSKLMKSANCNSIPYSSPKNHLDKGKRFYELEQKNFPLSIIGEHNLQNLEAARIVCNQLGLESTPFLEYMSDFEGAGQRMERIFDENGQVVFRDFAHSPSKLKATVLAVKDTYPEIPLTAFFELHTFSSLNEDFLPLYKDSMKVADDAYVYMDPAVFAHRNKQALDESFIQNCFGNVTVLTKSEPLKTRITEAFKSGHNLLLMSSGNFSKTELNFPSQSIQQ